jgi:hypothetical protein
MMYELDDVEERNCAHSNTFQIPTLEERLALRPGDLVRLIFKPKRKPGGERMWVEILGRLIHSDNHISYTGELRNSPITINGLQYRDVVRFEPKHVASINIQRRNIAKERSRR